MAGVLTVLRRIYKWSALFLCLAFFILPLASCVHMNETATAWNIAWGTGEVMFLLNNTYPVMFILLAIPVLMAVLGFTIRSFVVMRNVALLGLAGHLIFIVWFMVQQEFRNRLVEFAYGTWVVLLVYAVLSGVAHLGAFLTRKYLTNDVTMVFRL